MRSLWAAIVADRTESARTAFFPRAAYVRVKAISNAAADWRDRLFADFRLDVKAAHTVLGPGARRARFVRVQLPAAYVHWVPPGVCANDVGYWEVPNARVVYRTGGQERSFGIASMISWRGRWYVVHLGYVGPMSIGGRVDDPAVGPGASAPSSTC